MEFITYENCNDSRIPDGWTITVYHDGRAIPASPGWDVDSLGGWTFSLASYEDAIDFIQEMLKYL